MPKLMKQKIGHKEIKNIINGDLNDSFNEMLGIKAADPKIVIPKYRKCLVTLNLLIYKITLFAENKTLHNLYPGQVLYLKVMKNYADKLQKMLSHDGKPIRPADIANFSKTDISEMYLHIKKNNTTKKLFIYFSQIKNYEKYLKDKDNLNDTFILNSSRYRVYPFPRLCKLNLYKMWSAHGGDNCSEEIKEVRKYILLFLHNFYKLSASVCEIVAQADIDVKAFGKIIVECIAIAKKQIPRCELAFRKIEEAVDLLEDNFDGYYKDFIKTENPGVIFQSFIQDVSDEHKNVNRKLAFQFSKIMKHFSKNAESSKLTGHFKFLSEHISAFTGGAKDDEDTEDDDEDDEDTEDGEESDGEDDEDDKEKSDDSNITQ